MRKTNPFSETASSGRVVLDLGDGTVLDTARINASTPEGYGAKGDAVTNDAAAIQAAIDNANGRPVILRAGKTYKCNSTLTLKSGTRLEGHGATLDFSGIGAATGLTTHHGILAQGAIGAKVTVVGALNQWATTIPGVASTAGLTAGGLVKVSNGEKSVAGNTQPNDLKGELAAVKTVDSATQITLDAGLVLPYADDTKLAVQQVTPVENVSVQGVTIRMGGVGSGHNGITLRYVRGADITGVTILGGESTGVTLDHAWDCTVDGARISGSTSSATLGNTGYGVAVLNASKHVKVSRCTFDNCRAAVDGGGTSQVAYVTVENCMARNTSTAAFATHEPCFYWDFVDCQVNSAFGGYTIRGQHCTVTGGTITNVANAGVLWYADYGVTEQVGIKVEGVTINGAGSGVYIRGESTQAGNADCVKRGVVIDSVTVRNVLYNGFLVRNFDGATITGCAAYNTGDANFMVMGLTDMARSKGLVFTGNQGGAALDQSALIKWVDGVTGTGGSYRGANVPGLELVSCSGVALGYVEASTIHATGPALRVEDSTGVLTHPVLAAPAATKFTLVTAPGFSVDRSSGRSTGLRLIDLGAAGTLKLSREGNTVTATCDPFRPQATGTVKVADIPAGWEPPGTQTVRAVGMEGAAARLVTVTGGATMSITMSGVAAVNSYCYFTVRWQVVTEFPDPAAYPGAAG